MKQKISWWAAEASALTVPDEELQHWHVTVRQGGYAEQAESMLKFGYVFICEQEVEFFMPQLVDRIEQITQAIRDEIQRVRADAEMKARELNDKLENLLALSYEQEAK